MTIKPAANVYVSEDHVISCTLSDIPPQIIGVIWTSTPTKSDGYILMDGMFDVHTKSQVSTLTISSDKLTELKESAASHTFTCKITVGSRNTIVADIQTVTIFSPGGDIVLKFLTTLFYLVAFC